MALLPTVKTTWDEVLLVASASKEVCLFTAKSQREFFLNRAGRRFKDDQYGEFTGEIQAYAAAHYAQMARTQAAGLGPLSTRSVGDASATHTLPALNTDESWGETIYGREVKKIMRQRSFPSILVVNPKPV